ncbi:MAG TPA: polysaccharide deacetylase family protein [Vicinamibacteria bacterium]|nr:polysaccharide deacetylase family protein [Vicinamibacteria bacterium]
MTAAGFGFALTLAAAAAGAPPPPTLAERLGHPKDTKLVIVHADDLGEWHAVNTATIRALESGAVNSGSMMVPCPWFPEIAAWARDHPEADLGLHLAVTSERTAYKWGPVASRDRVPSLLDERGYLRQVQVDAARLIDAREVEIELRAQVERALAFGLKPSHLDSHQAVLYGREDLFAALVRVSRAYAIPLGLARSHVQEHPFMAAVLGEDALLIDRAFDIPPQIPPEKWGEWYEAEVRKIAPGVTAIVMHLGIADTELRAATADRPTWGAEWRQRDYDFFTSERWKALVRDNGLKLVTWRQLGALAGPPR